MDKIRKNLGIIIVIALLLSSSVPFLANTGAALAQDITPEEGTSGELSVKPAHMVLENVVEISR